MEIMKEVKVIKFISYNGRFPNLCSGTLVLEYSNKNYSFDDILSSGGSVSFTKDWDEIVIRDEWSIHESKLPDELKPYAKDIADLVNKNIPYGCCGRCV